MLKKCISFAMVLAVVCSLLAGCGQKEAPAAPETPAPETKAEEPAQTPAEPAEPENQCPLEDGVYSAKFKTDSTMFHANEACKGRCKLTVENGTMTIHVSLASTGIVNLYPGLAEEAQKDEAGWLQPSMDTVTYEDGLSDEVHGFDIPVPFLDDEFDCALVGTKGKWYDHKVSVSDPKEWIEEAAKAEAPQAAMGASIQVTLTGGSGKSTIESPCAIEQDETGAYWATVVWSSSHYDWMELNNAHYEPETREPGSTFRIQVTLDEDIPVQAQTSAMSTPHVIDYTLHFDSSTLAQ